MACRHACDLSSRTTHPGAQLSFTDHHGYRFQVFITNQTSRRIERLEQLHRQRAAVEDAIRCAKYSGLRNLPFRDFQANAVWLELVLCGQDLLRWTQRLLLSDTPARRWEPKRLRYRLLHVAGKLTRHARHVALAPRDHQRLATAQRDPAHVDARHRALITPASPARRSTPKTRHPGPPSRPTASLTRPRPPMYRVRKVAGLRAVFG